MLVSVHFFPPLQHPWICYLVSPKFNLVDTLEDIIKELKEIRFMFGTPKEAFAKSLIEEDLLNICDLIAELSHALTDLGIDLEKQVNPSFKRYGY